MRHEVQNLVMEFLGWLESSTESFHPRPPSPKESLKSLCISILNIQDFYFFVKICKKDLHYSEFSCRIISNKIVERKSQIVSQRVREAENA